MTLSFSGVFQPSMNPVKISVQSFGQILWFVLYDENNVLVDLTTCTSIQVQFEYNNDPTTRIIKTCVVSNPSGGMFYYLIQSNDFSSFSPGANISVFPVVNWASDNNYPSGRKIKAYSCSPATLQITD